MKKTTLFVLLIALGMAAYVYFYELRHGRGRDVTKDESTAAFPFAADDIVAITIERNGQKVALEKRNDTWRITAPVETRADQNAVSALVSSLAGARLERTLAADPSRLEDFGLAQPAVTVTIRLASGEEHALRLGARDFSGASVYAFVDQRREVALLPGSVLSAADKPLEELRDRSVLAFKSWEVTAAELRNPRTQFHLERRGEDWFLTAPRELRADESNVRDLLDAVSFAKVDEIVAETADSLARYGLDRPEYELRIRTENGEERTLLVGRRAPKATNKDDQARYYAKDTSRSMVFTISQSLVKEFDRTLFDLRSKRVAHFDRAQLRRLELRNEHLTLVAEKTADGKWLVREPAEQRDKEAHVSSILSALEFTRAEAILDHPAAAVLSQLEKPAVEVALTDSSGTTRIVVSAVREGKVYARAGENGPVLQFPESWFKQLNLPASELVSQPN
jgi:hypothetical protein